MSTKEHYARTSFSLPPRLLQDLDEVTRELGFGERSRALQTAIRNLVEQSRITKDAGAYATGTILLLYDHEKRKVDEGITDVGHQFGRLIVSSLHVHLEDSKCLIIVVVRGKLKRILELEQHLRELGGIIQIKSSFVLVDQVGNAGGKSSGS